MNDLDLGAYCRAVEAHLCRVNGGHLVRVVGVAFDLVQRWHADGVPLKIVLRGIERRAERAARPTGARRRPLRVEFCEADVADVLDEWRRAVGFALHRVEVTDVPDGVGSTSDTKPAHRAPSLSRHLDRVTIKLSSFLAGTRDVPALRARVEHLLTEVDGLRQQARGTRGEGRDAVVRRLESLDAALLDALGAEAPEAVLAAARDEAREDLAAYAGRLAPSEYARVEDAAARRIARERLGLPRLTLS